MTEYVRLKSPSSTKYLALADKPSGSSGHATHTIHKAAELEVYNARETPMYNFDHPNGIDVRDWRANSARNAESRYAEMQAEQGKHTQLSMLEHRPAEFDTFFSDPSMRIPSMVLAARAVLDHPGITSAYNLSKHSSRLVHRGMELGVVQGHPDNPSAEITNSIDMDERKTFRPLGGWSVDEKLSDTEVREAKEKPRNLNQHQFHQLSLFGEHNG